MGIKASELRELRKRAGWSYRVAAKKTGFTSQYILMMESGKRPVSQPYLDKVLSALITQSKENADLLYFITNSV